VNPRAEPNLIALAQQTVVRILGVAKLGIGIAKLSDVGGVCSRAR